MSVRCKYNTKNKNTILSIIKLLDFDFTAKDVKDTLFKKNINMGVSTIYRILDELLEENIIVKNLDNSTTSSYRYIKPCNSVDHVLLKCNSCNKVIHLDCEFVSKLKKHINKNHEFIVNTNKSFLPGICTDCLKLEEEKNEKENIYN